MDPLCNFTRMPLDVLNIIFTQLTELELVKLRQVDRRLNSEVDKFVAGKQMEDFVGKTIDAFRSRWLSKEWIYPDKEMPLSERYAWAIEKLSNTAMPYKISLYEPFISLYKRVIDQKNLGLIKKLVQDNLGIRLLIAALDCPMFLDFEDGTLYGRCGCGVWKDSVGSICLSTARIRGILTMGVKPTEEILNAAKEGRLNRRLTILVEDYALCPSTK